MGCRLRVRAADLQVGDRTIGSRATITRAPSVGVRTTPGHVDLSVDYGSGPTRRSWRRDTLIGIERGSTVPEGGDV